MNDIKFNCPQCGQLLAVAEATAGATVACPKCGQVVLVPVSARTATPVETPEPRRWGWVIAGIVAVGLFSAGAFIWQTYRRPIIQAKKTVSTMVSSKQVLLTGNSLSSNDSGKSSISAVSAQEVHSTINSKKSAPDTFSPAPTKKGNGLATEEAEAGFGPSMNRHALSNWFVILDDSTNGFQASPGVPQTATAALKEAQLEKANIKCFAFTPAGEWVLLDGNSFETSSKEMPSYPHLNGNATFVMFAPEGPSIILYPRGGFWRSGLPGPLLADWRKALV